MAKRLTDPEFKLHEKVGEEYDTYQLPRAKEKPDQNAFRSVSYWRVQVDWPYDEKRRMVEIDSFLLLRESQQQEQQQTQGVSKSKNEDPHTRGKDMHHAQIGWHQLRSCDAPCEIIVHEWSSCRQLFGLEKCGKTADNQIESPEKLFI